MFRFCLKLFLVGNNFIFQSTACFAMHEFIVCAFLICVDTTLKHVLKFPIHVKLLLYIFQ